jgi:hypothetical protein
MITVERRADGKIEVSIWGTCYVFTEDEARQLSEDLNGALHKPVAYVDFDSMSCPYCTGTGQLASTDSTSGYVPCHFCNGTGRKG